MSEVTPVTLRIPKEIHPLLRIRAAEAGTSLNAWIVATLENEIEKPSQPAKELRTKTGRVMTDEEIQALADEAERGYDVESITPRSLPYVNPPEDRDDTPPEPEEIHGPCGFRNPRVPMQKCILPDDHPPGQHQYR